MTPAVIIERATSDGLRLALSPAGTIKATGETAALNRWLPLIRDNKPGIVDILKESYDPATETRRGRVLAMLTDPNVRYAMEVNEPDTDPVRVMVGIRNVATFELEIPASCYNPAALLELLDKHSGVVCHE